MRHVWTLLELSKCMGLSGCLLVGACALPASHLARVASVDSTRHGGGEFEALAMAALIVLVLIPTLVKKRS